jgi:hypothetical protein
LSGSLEGFSDMSIDSSSETAILSRVIAPDEPALSAQLAQLVLSFSFGQEDKDRMRQLCEKASEGSLSAEEQDELDCYERVGHFLSLLQSKARLSLKRAQGASQ